jgi:hypothetical protein
LRKLDQTTSEKHFNTSILSNLPPRPNIFFLLPFIACLLGSPTISFADFTGPGVAVLDGDTHEVLHNQRPDRIRLPQSQRHAKERRNPPNRKNGEAHILACHQLSCTFVDPHNQTRQPTEHGE